MANVSDLLAGIPEDERAAKKAEALAELLNKGSFGDVVIERFGEWTLNGVTITVSAVVYDAARKHFCVWLTAADANGSLPTPTGEFRFINPPIIHKGVEDIAGAVQQFIYEAVVDYASARGWSPM